MSRGRKRTKSKSSGQRVLRAVGPPEVCDCPACSGEEQDLDPQLLVDDLVAGGAELLEAEDSLEAELFAAGFVAAGELAGEGFAEALAEVIVPAVAQSGTPESLAVVLALAAVTDAPEISDAARRLIDSGVPAPSWAADLRPPTLVGACRRFADPDGVASMLICSFGRSGEAHGFVVRVDHLDCDAAVDVVLFPGEALDQVVDTIQADAGAAGLTLLTEVLDPAEFRWQVEHALDARAVHDREADGPDVADLGDDDGPGYHLLAALLRAWLRALPEPPRPPAAHGDDDASPSAVIWAREQGIPAGAPRRGGSAPKLPAKRKKSGPAAPVYQLKVSLRGAKPPIWRRLEVPADTGLAELHGIIQTAFGWHDSHMHVFETAYGQFGIADRELGHRAEAPVTLEQVAPRAGDRLGYTYDFGDNWDHEIVVEKLLDRQPGAYPRCTGGRRAAPLEDSGGIWGYEELVEVLSDPGHPEHDERLEWLGLESAAEFQPARFDAAEVTRALTGSR